MHAGEVTWWKPSTWPEYVATLLIALALIVAGFLMWLKGPTLAVLSANADNPQLGALSSTQCAVPVKGAPVKVSDASGATGTLNIFIGRGGAPVQRQSAPLVISGTLAPGTVLCTGASDLVRGDGQSLPANQLVSQASNSNNSNSHRNSKRNRNRHRKRTPTPRAAWVGYGCGAGVPMSHDRGHQGACRLLSAHVA